MKSKLLLFVGIVAIGALILFRRPPVTKQLPEITVKDTKVFITISDSDVTRARGLGRVTKLEENEGMLFIFPDKAIRSFWMKDMYIDLDMIWITDGKIANITKNVPAPLPQDRNSPMLPQYSSLVPVDYVLEVNAGFSDIHQLKVGDTVDLSSVQRQ